MEKSRGSRKRPPDYTRGQGAAAVGLNEEHAITLPNAMGDTTRRRLRNFEGRTTVPVQGWGAVVFGLLFAGAGSIPLLVGVGMMVWAAGPTRPPGWVVAVVGAVFIIFGLAALAAGARGLHRRRRARRAYLAGATAPWDWDHPWDRHGARDDVWRRALRRFAWIAFLALFLSPFHYLLLTIEDTTFRVLGGLFLLVFDAAVVFTLAGAVRAVMQGLKYGRVFLQYEQFPMLLGRPAAVRLMFNRPVDARGVECAIRLVEETVEVSSRGRGKNSRQYVFDQLYEEKLTATLSPGTDGRQTARVEFRLPEGDYSTRLSGEEPRYWLFEAEAATPGVDFQARFLLPIYAPTGHAFTGPH